MNKIVISSLKELREHAVGIKEKIAKLNNSKIDNPYIDGYIDALSVAIMYMENYLIAEPDETGGGDESN